VLGMDDARTRRGRCVGRRHLHQPHLRGDRCASTPMPS
jgi:hypothetical protein